MKTKLSLLIIGLSAAVLAQETPPATSSAPSRPPARAVGTNNQLRLNFRGVPLEMVLNYLGEATDLIINVVPGTDVKGKVDVWSNQPLTKEEAVDLLNTILNQNKLAAIRNNRTLTIVGLEDAKTRNIPVRAGNKPDEIPRSDQMVTQIIPVQHANAMQLVQNLQALLPSYATLSANESGNALVLTGTQSDAHRFAEIVQALDTSISSISSIRVFPLNYADAKELATAVKELFEPPQQNANDRRTQFLNRFFGGGGGPGGGGPGGGGPAAFFGGQGGPGGQGGRGNTGSGTSSGSGNPAASRVVAVADERSNSLIVSAPEELISTIELVVKEIDVPVSDITELRVFHLKNADPVEMADLFSNLFPDETNANNNNQQNFRFGGGGGPGGGPGGFLGGPFGGNRGGRNNNQSNASDRMKKKGRVTAVADQRTSSIIVSAASELMPQIEEMIAQLDSPAKKQKVFVYSLENADVQQVEQIVRDMFDRSNTSMNRNNANQNSPLLNRSQQNQNNMGNGAGNNGGFGNQQGGFGGGNQLGQGFR
jgi:type II secretory pathway component GspD/PulD (secretin)